MGPLWFVVLWRFLLKNMSTPSTMIFWNHQHVIQPFLGGNLRELPSRSIPYWRRCR